MNKLRVDELIKCLDLVYGMILRADLTQEEWGYFIDQWWQQTKMIERAIQDRR